MVTRAQRYQASQSKVKVSNAVSAAAAVPSPRGISLSFNDDLDRELFVTEVEHALRKRGPRRIETWNASCTVPIKAADEAVTVRRIAQKYDGVKLSLSEGNVAAAAATIGKEITQTFTFPSSEALSNFTKMLWNGRTPTKKSKKTETSITITTDPKSMRAVMQSAANFKGKASAPGAAASLVLNDGTSATPGQPTQEAPKEDMALTFLDASQAQAFASRVMQMGAKVEIDGMSVKASFANGGMGKLFGGQPAAASGNVAAAATGKETTHTFTFPSSEALSNFTKMLWNGRTPAKKSKKTETSITITTDPKSMRSVMQSASNFKGKASAAGAEASGSPTLKEGKVI